MLTQAYAPSLRRPAAQVGKPGRIPEDQGHPARQAKAKAQIPLSILKLADPRQAKPIIKLMSRMLRTPKGRGKRTTTSADVKIGHKKKVRYW